MKDQTQPGSMPGGNLPLPLAMFSDRLTDRGRKLLMTYMVGQALWSVGRGWWAKAQAEARYSVAVEADDSLYADAHHWLMEQVPSRKRRAVTARTDRRDSPVAIGDPPSLLRLFFEGDRPQSLMVDGHRIRVRLERADWSALLDLAPSKVGARGKDRMVFVCDDQAGRDALIGVLNRLCADRQQHPPRFMTPRWSEWLARGEVSARPLGSVVLAGGRKEVLKNDLERFLGSESTYARLGIPWHRGYLLHGPPGCGKTSIVRALAGHLHLDVYYLPLSSVTSDDNLNHLLHSVPSRSVLILEDVDVVHAARERDDKVKGITLAGLLNALDGFATPHGLVTVMTTNDRDALDPALIRPGRVDMDIEIGYLDRAQLLDLVEAMLGRRPQNWGVSEIRDRLTPAEVVDAVKSHLDDPETAEWAIWELVQPRALVSDDV